MYTKYLPLLHSIDENLAAPNSSQFHGIFSRQCGKTLNALDCRRKYVHNDKRIRASGDFE